MVKSNCKKRARLNAMRYVLQQFNYTNKDSKHIGKIDPLIVGRSNVVYEQGEHALHSPSGLSRTRANSGLHGVSLLRPCAGYRSMAHAYPLKLSTRHQLLGPVQHLVQIALQHLALGGCQVL